MTTPIAFYYNFSLAFSGLLISAKGRSVRRTCEKHPAAPTETDAVDLISYMVATGSDRCLGELVGEA